MDENSICSTEFQVVYPTQTIYYGFIYYLLKSKQVTEELIGAAGGTSGSHQRVKTEDIFNLSFQMSPDERIVEFNLITYDQMKKVSTNMKQIHTLEKLRDMLLPKLISGKVRVKYK
jgi:type I restriction enzyme S subunit